MSKQTGYLWDVIEEWIDGRRPFHTSQRDLAKVVGVGHSTITDWKYARTMPSPRDLKALAAVLQVPYERALNAVLIDHEYRDAPAVNARRPRRGGELTEHLIEHTQAAFDQAERDEQGSPDTERPASGDRTAG